MSNSHPSRALPVVPNVEQQKKRARELLNAARAGDADALRRFRDYHPRLASAEKDPSADALSLHDAQLVIAREYGFPSWPKLIAHIESILSARRTRIFVRDVGYHDERAHGLLAILPDGAHAVLEQVRTWHPEFASASDDEIRAAAFGIEDARLVYARQHGFPSWARFVAHLNRLRDDPSAEPFLMVFDAGRRGDWKRVSTLLREHPELLRARGTNGNTLLNLACSLLPCAPNASGGALAGMTGQHRLDVLRLLIGAGAEVRQANDRGWTPLHQAAYRNDVEMAQLLLDAGAPIDVSAHGDGGTPLAVALFWGHREVATVLAERGVTPANLRVAAGLGDRTLVAHCFGANGDLTFDAMANRSFYRPHSGFPTWRPSDEPQEVLDEALVWAAKSDATQVMPLLVERGARVDADPYRGTPLIWAAANGREEAVRQLIHLGADVNQRGTFGGPSHGESVTALHLAAQNDHADTIALLLAHGADPRITDTLYQSTPAGWAEHGNARRAIAALAVAGGRGG